jgi:hypothetical protein
VSARNDLTPERLRGLAAIRAEQKTVLSLYLNLDPERFATPRARTSEIDSLLDGAHREIEAGQRPHSELMALRAALERAREILADEDQPWAEDAHAVALFISSTVDTIRAAGPRRATSAHSTKTWRPTCATSVRS